MAKTLEELLKVVVYDRQS